VDATISPVDHALFDRLEAGRAAFARHEWAEAYAQLDAVDREAPLAAADLERLADAARWSSHYHEMLDAFERSEAAYASDGDHRGAARAALQLTWEHFQRGDEAVMAGWYGRAARLLEGDTECAEYALLLCLLGVSAFAGGDFEEAGRLLAEATETARRVGDRDIESLSHIYRGHVLVNTGDSAAGLALVDEATAAAMSGELGVQVAGSIYCSTIFLCRNRGDWRRAGEWTDASLRWCERESIGEFPGLCRFHRAEVMRFRGALAEAERDALAAADLLLAAAPRYAGWPFHELGEVRRRMGDRAGAAEAFRRSAELGFDPQPGLALLRLDEGDIAGSRASVRRALADDEGLSYETRGLILPAAVTIELAAGDIDAAKRALADLEARAAESGTVVFAAATAVARAEIALAEGRTDDAVRDLRTASRSWGEVDAPFEAARARVLLAGAYQSAAAEADATLELQAARAMFERLGAALEVDRVDALLARPAVPTRHVRTFMFTDIVDSTKLVELLGDDAWLDLLRWHDRTLRAAFADHRGEEIKHEGDGFFIAFSEAVTAIECARAIQRELADHRRDHGFAPRVRIGVHAAEATEVGGDYAGRGVHAAARISAAAGGGEIFVSRSTLDAVGRAFTVDDTRTLDLKGFADPVDVDVIAWQDG
jgi:class 3 adenylate cyclase